MRHFPRERMGSHTTSKLTGSGGSGTGQEGEAGESCVGCTGSHHVTSTSAKCSHTHPYLFLILKVHQCFRPISGVKLAFVEQIMD